MLFEKEKIFHEKDYQENKSAENHQHRKLLLDQYNYEENCFHIWKIHRLIEKTRK